MASKRWIPICAAIVVPTLVASVASTLIAIGGCGGKTTDDAGPDTAVTAIDTGSESDSVSIDGRSDLGDAADSGTCPATCTANATCQPRTGEICTCRDDKWVCRPCDQSSPLDACPTRPACLGQSCSGKPLSCYFNGGCGAVDQTVCGADKLWHSQLGACVADCPDAEPVPGALCAKSTLCRIASSCGLPALAACASNHWTLSRKCPATSCPTLPLVGSTCGPEHGDCLVGNGCGGEDRAVCLHARWAIEKSPCCPVAPPGEGSTCTSPSTVPCRYPSTSLECYCQPDKTFRCMIIPPSCRANERCTPGYSCSTSSEYCVCAGEKLSCYATTEK